MQRECCAAASAYLRRVLLALFDILGVSGLIKHPQATPLLAVLLAMTPNVFKIVTFILRGHPKNIITATPFRIYGSKIGAANVF